VNLKGFDKKEYLDRGTKSMKKNFLVGFFKSMFGNFLSIFKTILSLVLSVLKGWLGSVVSVRRCAIFLANKK